MLEDRSYMRDPLEKRASATVVIIITCVVMFLAQEIFRVYFAQLQNASLTSASAAIERALWIPRFLMLSWDGLRSGYLWQLVTFQFLHGGWWHLIMNCLGLYFLGRRIETLVGTRRYLAMYLLGGVAGGLFQVLGGFVLPGLGGAVVGASAGICTIVGAVGSLMAHEEFMMFAYFIPIRVKGFQLAGILAITSIVMILLPSGDHIAHGAHLGGLIFGYAFARWYIQAEQPFWTGWFPKRVPKLKPGESRIIVLPDLRKEPVAEPEDFITKEIDPILDKMNAYGRDSLTEREKRILDSAKDRLNRGR